MWSGQKIGNKIEFTRELTTEELNASQNETNKLNIAELAKEVLIMKSII